MGKHALLSPSKSSMWLNCPPSARLGEGFNTGNDAADEGTLAHSLSELLLKRMLGRIGSFEYSLKLKQLKESEFGKKFYNASMLEHCSQFATYVMERYNEMVEKHGHVIVLLEQNLDLKDFIPEGFGTGDVILAAENEVNVFDLKFGKGVLVRAEENTQMMIYALGTLALLSMFFAEPEKVGMTIYQPRLDNIDSWEVKTEDLLEWARKTLLQKAKLAFEGKGKRSAGKHCTFCPVKATCAAHAKYNLTVAGEEFDQLLDKPAEELSDEHLVEIYMKGKQIRAFIDSVEKMMLKKAEEGKKWKGLKLIHGRSNRIITKPEEIIKILKAKKIDPKKFLSEPTLLGITALEANIGAKAFLEMAGKYIAKPKGKPSLVHEDSKGVEYNPLSSAIEDFF